MIVLETIADRWWALAFIPAFLWAARAERGTTRALRFMCIAAITSFVAEYASTHWGFPFGRYDYTTATRGDELFVSNVPVFVPLTFGVVVWAGRAIAERATAWSGWRLALGGALCATAIDLVIDPVTLRGEQWFFGALYTYRADGWWFGVPSSNFAGWLLVSFAIIAIDELFGTAEHRWGPPRGVWLGIGTCLFFVATGFAIGEPRAAFAGLVVTAALGVIAGRAPRGTLRSPS